MNKQDLIKKIKDLTDISNDEKAYLIELVNTKKKYGLVWEDKPEDVEEQLRSMLPVFKEVKERAIISENTDAPNHILIEGDNLHALTALSYTHEGKVDVIYIDPPYNTGNKDFIYNDAYVDKEDTYRHSKWLSFMDKRLRLAKKLLSEKGVIFISIDDNEQSQLKLLCDEIFGENNFITNIIWQKKTGASDAKSVSTNSEYILVYTSKTDYQGEIFSKNKESYDLKRYKYKDEFFEKRGPYYLDTLDRGGLRYSDSLNYAVECPDGSITYPNGRKEFLNDGWTFKWGREKLQWGLENKFIDFRKNPKKPSGWSVCYKNYLNVDNEGNVIERAAPRNNMILDIKNADGASDIKAIFDKQVFKYTKPVKLIKLFLEYINSKNITILDFFAGSGTTLHATMALNAEDGGNRQCILVTNNENKIAEEVTYERNKRVIQGYTNAKGEQVEGLTNNNLRYYQADFVPSERTERNRRLLTARSTELLCIKENCFIDKTNDFGINEKQAKLFSNGLGKYMVVVYHTRNQVEVINQLSSIISGLETSEKVKVYAFSPEKEIIEDDFYKVADKITAVPLPDSIYNAYRATFRTLKLDKKEAVSSTTNQEA